MEKQRKMEDHIDRLTRESFTERALPPASQSSVEAHLAICPACRARAAAAQQMSKLLYSMPREKPAADLAARINAGIASRRAAQAAPTPRWIRVLVPAMFAVGLVLLALASPQWGGWVQAASTAQMPTQQAVINWVADLATDPAPALDTALGLVEPMIAGATVEMNLLMTLGAMLIASASVAGLAQLLGGERLAPVAVDATD